MKKPDQTHQRHSWDAGRWRIDRHLRSWLLEAVRWMIGPWRRVEDDADRAAGSRPLNILVFQYDAALGSVIAATPILESLRTAQPGSTIVVASSGIAYEVVKYNPFADRVINTPNPYSAFMSTAWWILRSLRLAQKWDCVITDIGNAKTRLAVLGAITGAHRRIGFTAAPSLYHIPLHRDPQMSVMRDNLRLPAALGLRSEAAEPRVFFSQYEALAAETLLSQHGLTDAAGLTVFFTQTSGGQPSRWYDERFAIVADHLATRHDSAIIFGGTRGERDAIERIRSLMTRASINIAGDTKTVSVLAALLCRADMAVSLDTGPMHLARAAGLPTVVIAPAWQPAYEWLPLGFDDCTIVRRNEIPCAGCRKFVCETRECMDEITTEEVISATEALWLRYPPSPLRRQERTARSLAARREMTNAKG